MFLKYVRDRPFFSFHFSFALSLSPHTVHILIGSAHQQLGLTLPKTLNIVRPLSKIKRLNGYIYSNLYRWVGPISI